MEAQLNEANTFPSQSYAQSFFSKLPTDNRFLQRTFAPIPLKSSLKGKTITFVAEKFQAANIYMIQDAHIEIRMVITKQNGEVPLKTAIVAPRNNVVHTVFESCRLYLNDVLFSTNSTDYHYKSYICTTLTFPMNVKANQLQASGFVSDSSGFFNDCTANTGFTQRNNMFRVGGLAANDYRKSGAEFIGRLFHDLIACESGIPPNISIKIELDKAPASFVLQCPSTDKELYDYKLTHAALYIPVGQLSASVYNELSTIMARNSEGSISIHYRRLEIRPILLSKGNQDHYFKPLLSDAECPCKLVICFVESDAKSGSYHKNPFEFRRSWKYETPSLESNYEKEDLLTEKINHLESMQSKLQSQLDDFASKFFENAEKLLRLGTPTAEKQMLSRSAAKSQNLASRKETENTVEGASSQKSHQASSPDGFQVPGGSDLQASTSHAEDLGVPANRFRSMSTCSEYATASNAPSAGQESVGKFGFGTETVVQYIKGITLTLNSTAVDQVKTYKISLDLELIAKLF